MLGDEGGTLLVELDDGTPDDGGNVIGDVSWRAVHWGPNRGSVAWSIGITLGPDYRGHGYGPEAQAALCRYLFETTTAKRIEATTDITNEAEKKALERAGFHREGVLRGAQYRNGAWHDLVMFSRLRSDPSPE